MRKLKFSLFAVICLLSLVLFWACSDDPVSPVTTGTVIGRVIDAESVVSIENASITTTPATNAITTDSAGEYIIPDVEEGKFSITASKNGYRNGIVSVNVLAGDTAEAIIQLDRETNINTVPNRPTLLSPDNGAENLGINVLLKWEASDPDVHDTLYYDVYLYASGSDPELIVSNSQVDSFWVKNLLYGRTYYWQVIVEDNNEGVANGNIWRFSTEDFPDNPLIYSRIEDGNYEIFSADIDTLDSRIVQITDNSNREWWPRFGPNRDRIAFVSDRQVEPQIFLMNMDGSNVNQISNVPIAGYHNYGLGFEWSDDGTQFVYSHYEKLYRIDNNGTGLTQLATAPADRHFREVDWSPLGNKLVALTIGNWFYDSEIYVMDANGANMTLLVGNLSGAIVSPSFSPDGGKIIFSHDVSGYEVLNKRQLNSHIIIANIATGDTIDISQNKTDGTNDFYPRFSPDGSKVIFCNAPNNETSKSSIWIMDTNGENRRKIISNGIMPDWQ